MDRDNPFASSYLREGVTRVQKPRLTYRQAEPTPSQHPPVSPLKRTQPHLRLQRRLSLTEKPSTDDDLSEGDMTPRAVPSIRSTSTATRRSSNPRRVVRPADHSRPTVHFSNGRSEVLLTLPAPANPPELPTAPTSTALTRQPSASNLHRNSAPVFGNNYTTRRPSFGQSYSGSTTGSLSTNHHSVGKKVTFDSSETEDSQSCLSASTQATSVEEHNDFYHDYYYGPEKQQAAMQAQVQQEPAPVRHSLPPVMTTVAPPQPIRRRSRSFSGIDREFLQPEASELVRVPARRWQEAYSYVPADEMRQDMQVRKQVEQPPSVSSVSTDTDKNIQAQFEAHKVALEAQFEQRQQMLEADKKKLADELHAAVTALGKAQADGHDLRREANEQRQRVLALAQENDDLKDDLHETKKTLEKEDRAREEAENQELFELKADLESAKRALDDTRVLLKDAQATLAEASLGLDDLRKELADEQDAAALFREGKAAFEERCADLEAKCSGLESQVVAARDANKELHLLMASQIDDLTATKEALQVRIGILEEEEAARVAATAAAVEAAKVAEDKQAEATTQFDDEKRGLNEKLAAAEENKTTLETEKEALTTELTEAKAKIETLTADVAAKTEELATLTDDLIAANDAKAALQATIDGHGEVVDKARQEAGESATAAHTQETDALKTTITKLEADIAAVTAERDTLKAAAEAKSADTTESGDAPPADNDLQEKMDKLEAAHAELQEKHSAVEAALAAEKTEREAAATALTTAQEAAAASLKEAQDAESAAKDVAAAAESALAAAQEEATTNAAHAARVPELSERLHQLQSAYATSEAEGMALRDQLAKMRAKLAGVAASVASSSATKKSSKGKKDDLVIVRTPGDRGRFQVMRKSELHRSRSNSRSSRRTDYDSN
ncbi:hypothetical protein SEUCBS140593_006072 [Sporothrix eucalyptigena]|uniref:Viral a-type inclusion protein n=1 Tax=Sporothrix eucalyptigena TaxID=1812306 RepID=A0ABP0C3W6_9PEZI